MKTLERDQEPTRVAFQAPVAPPKRLMAVANMVVRFLLRSPFHFLLSNSLLLLTYWGCKTGKRYTNPITYSREGDTVIVFTYRSWWKNLRGGAPVLVEIKRHRLSGTAEVICDDHAEIAIHLLALLQKHPKLAKGYHIPLDADGQPTPAAVQQAAHFVVLVRIHLIEPLSASRPDVAKSTY